MSWEKIPEGFATTGTSTASLFGGIQLGTEIAINSTLSTYIFYRYLKTNYASDIKLDTGTQEIGYNSDQNLNIGIKYNF
jgi:opacity protein-like surface antigen